MCPPLTLSTSWTGCPVAWPLHTGPFQAQTGTGRGPRSGLCSLKPQAVCRAPAPPLFCSDSTSPGPELGGFPGLLLYRLFRLPFCWGYQSSGFLGWLCFNLSPWSRLRGLPLSLCREEMEDPGSLWGRLWSQRISRNRCRDRPAAPRPRQPASLQTGPVNY